MAAKCLVAGAIAVVLLGIYVFSLFIDSTSLVLIQVLNVPAVCDWFYSVFQIV